MAAQPLTLAATVGRDELTEILRDYMAVAERLRQTHETLQTEVERLRVEVEQKDRELERRQRLAALGELAAGVAHEVRNPLGAIQLFAGLLRRECVGADQAGKLLDKIDGAIRTIDGVVQDTLALAPRGGEHLPIRVGELIERAAELCQTVLNQRVAHLSVELERDTLSVGVDARSMQRVILNLIANAAEASPPGSRITIRAKANAQIVSIEVADEGPGLPEEILERIFDPFFTTKPHGTGLGLSIAHRVVEAHGGRLSAENGPTGGAVFCIELPASASE